MQIMTTSIYKILSTAFHYSFLFFVIFSVLVSFQALVEIDDLLKYLDRAENEINTADPISADPDALALQLRNHKV